MFSDTILFECFLRTMVLPRDMRLAAYHGVMSCGIGVAGRFYNKVRGL